MDTVRIRLKNYRAFSDQIPAELCIHQGFTAFVGPNNSGKSSLLRMLFELRPVLAHLANSGGMIPLLRAEAPGISFSVQLPALEDPTEIFCNDNDRDLEVDIETLDSSQSFQRRVHATPQLRRIAIRARRPSPYQEINWTVQFMWPQGARPSIPVDNITDGVWIGDSNPVLDLNPLLQGFSRLSSTFYIGPFRNVLSAQHELYFDMLIGSRFVATWNEWQSGPIKKRNRIIAEIISSLQGIFGLKQLEITPAFDGKNLHARVNSEPYRLRELGGGFSQFLVTLANAAFGKGMDLLLIDEPELGLHPSLQLDFLTALSAYARVGTLFATHSMGLARSAAEHVYTVQSTPRGSAIVEYTGLTNLTEFAGAMAFSSYAAIGFDTLLLVEGVTEVKTVQQWLRLFGSEHRVVIFPMGGDQLVRDGVDHELCELKRITQRIFAIVDSERERDGDPPRKERMDFESLCKRIGINVAVTDRRATENYLTDAAVKAEKGPNYRSPLPFERLKDLTYHWAKSDNWKIARHMTRADIENTDFGRFLATL